MHAVAISLGAALCLGLAAPVQAQAPVRIGFVNVNFILQNAPQTAAVNATLNSEFAPREAGLVERQTAWNTKREGLERDAAVMPQSERDTITAELRTEEREIQRLAADLQEDFEIRQTELVNELQANVARRIQAFAVAAGFDLIVTNQGVVYASEAIDITEDVLRALSSGSGTGGATSDPAPAPSAPEE
jgi:outer membrane protein